MKRWVFILAGAAMLMSAPASAVLDEQDSKIIGFGVLQGTDDRDSKIIGFAVLAGSQQAASKIIGFAVLCTSPGTAACPSPPSGGGGGLMLSFP